MNAPQSISRLRRFSWHLVRCGFVAIQFACCEFSSAQEMVFPGASWEVASPESVLFDSVRLQDAIDRENAGESTNQWVIVRNGRVIWQGGTPDATQHVASVTKSFTSTALGLLVDDGRVTLNSLVKDYAPALAEDYGDATIRHFVTHTGGYLATGEFDLLPVNVGARPDDPFDPATPLFAPPGSQFAYTGTELDMLANVLTRAAGESLQELFTRRIAVPIGIKLDDFSWREFAAKDGTTITGGSGYYSDEQVEISASNLARLGHLLLNGGRWDGVQLLSEEWIEQATQVQVPVSVPTHPLSASASTAGPGEYGLGWWVKADRFAAVGYGDNYLIVNPSLNLVIAGLGGIPINWDNFAGRIESSVMNLVWDAAGDGTWGERDVVDGRLRRLSESGGPLTIYPAPHTGNAIVKSNLVHVTGDERVNVLNIESGGVTIDPPGRLHVGRQLLSNPGTTLDIGGALRVGQLDIAGTTVRRSRRLRAKCPNQPEIRR